MFEPIAVLAITSIPSPFAPCEILPCLLAVPATHGRGVRVTITVRYGRDGGGRYPSDPVREGIGRDGVTGDGVGMVDQFGYSSELKGGGEDGAGVQGGDEVECGV